MSFQIKKKVMFGFFVLVLFLGFAAAIEVPIVIKTLPQQNVSVIVAKSGGEYQVLDKFADTSGEEGIVRHIISVDTETINVYVTVKKVDIKLLYQKFLDLDTSGTIELEAYPFGFKPNNYTEPSLIVEDFAGTVTEENTTESNGSLMGGLTGNVVVDDIKSASVIPLFMYFIVIGLIVVGAFSYGMISRNKRRRLQGLDGMETISYERELKEAEEKVEEAQEKLENVKKKEQIITVEKKLLKDKEELENLKRNINQFQLKKKEIKTAQTGALMRSTLQSLGKEAMQNPSYGQQQTSLNKEDKSRRGF